MSTVKSPRLEALRERQLLRDRKKYRARMNAEELSARIELLLEQPLNPGVILTEAEREEARNKAKFRARWRIHL